MESFQRCGILAWGFARVRCPGCRPEYLLAFSCKQRGLCPSCQAKRQVPFGELVSEQILEPVPHRHVVFSLPRRLRPYFRRKRKRFTRLAHLAYEMINDLLQVAVGSRTAVPGAVACLRSAGNLLDWHPHVHLLVSWGLFSRDGSFVPVEVSPDPETLTRLFRHKVLRLLLEKGAIDGGVVANLLAWPHTGFGAHVSREIPADHRTPAIVARYMTRTPILPDRILGDGATPKVVYRSDVIHPRYQANFRALDPLDFLAEVSAHIPDWHEKTTIFYGWYSNRTRGFRKARGLLAPGGSVHQSLRRAHEPPLAVRRSWARLICKVYEVDPLLCPRCGGTMKVIAVIEDGEVIYRILSHLNLLAPGDGPRAPPRSVVSGSVSPASVGSRELIYEPVYDDLPWRDPA